MKVSQFLAAVLVLLLLTACQPAPAQSSSAPAAPATPAQPSSASSVPASNAPPEESSLAASSAPSPPTVTSEKEERRKLEAVSLTNDSETTILKDAKIGDSFLGMLVTHATIVQEYANEQWRNQEIVVGFSGEKQISVWYTYSKDDPFFYLDFSPEQNLDEIPNLYPYRIGNFGIRNGEELKNQAEQILASLPAQPAQSKGNPIFLCNLKVDNFSLGSLRQSASARLADVVEITSIEYLGHFTSEEIRSKLGDQKRPVGIDEPFPQNG